MTTTSLIKIHSCPRPSHPAISKVTYVAQAITQFLECAAVELLLGEGLLYRPRWKAEHQVVVEMAAAPQTVTPLNDDKVSNKVRDVSHLAQLLH